jgi:thiamine biosynthesis lipoprotein
VNVRAASSSAAAATATATARSDPDRDRLVHVEHVMGTAVSIHVRAPLPAAGAIEAACAVLHDIDRRFSLYRPDSELGRLARGEIDEARLSPDVRWVLAACDDLARTSGGAFDARHHRADGVVDPSGFVKGWAVEEAARCLDDAGARSYVIAAGGDILARGESAPGRPWRVGIRHPGDPTTVIAVLAVRDGAVATSGLYERGAHVRDPRTAAVPDELVSLTVVGPSLAWADAYATGAFAMGLAGLAWVHGHPGYGALAVTPDERVTWTPAVEERLVREARSEPKLSASSQTVGVF